MAILDWTWSYSDWALLFLAAGVVLYVWGTSTYSRFTRQGIPHLTPLPFIGSLGRAIFKQQPPSEMINEDYNKFIGHPYGVIFMFRQPFIMLTDLELIKAVAIKDFEYFTDHLTTFIENGEPLWSKGLITLKGE
jgi:cytochrome P450 family 9